MIDRDTLSRLAAPAKELFGNEPIVLDGPPMLRFVESGSVALFCAEADGDKPTGPRRLIQRIGSGQSVLAIPEEFPPGLRFLIVPIKQAVIRELPLEDCIGPNADPGLRAAAAALVDGWVETLARILTPEYPEPKLTVKAGEGALALEAGQALSADRKGARWIKVESGASHFLGLEGITPVGPGGVLPVGAGLWAGVRDDSRVTSSPTASAPPAEVVEGLVLLHRIALAVLNLQAEDEEAEELERLRERERIQTEKRRGRAARAGLGPRAVGDADLGATIRSSSRSRPSGGPWGSPSSRPASRSRPRPTSIPWTPSPAPRASARGESP